MENEGDVTEVKMKTLGKQLDTKEIQRHPHISTDQIILDVQRHDDRTASIRADITEDRFHSLVSQPRAVRNGAIRREPRLYESRSRI